MRYENNRDIGYYVLDCSPQKGDAPKHLFTLEEIIEQLRVAQAKGECRREYSSNTQAISIKDVLISDSGIAVFLLNLADIKKPNPSFENFHTGEIRTEKKKPGEGIGDSIHMAIDLKAYDHANRYICLIEQLAGFSRSQITRFFDVLSRDICLTKSYLNVEGKSKETGPKIDTAILDDTITNDLQYGGSITGVTLVSDFYKGDGLDEPQWMESSRAEYIIKASPGASLDAIVRWATKTKLREQYKRIKVNYKTSTGRIKNALAQEKEDSLEFAFGKITTVELIEGIASSAITRIHTELGSAMIRMLEAERDKNNASSDDHTAA